jgi:hypothetical protein
MKYTMHNKGTARFFWDVSGLGSGVFVALVGCCIFNIAVRRLCCQQQFRVDACTV